MEDNKKEFELENEVENKEEVKEEKADELDLEAELEGTSTEEEKELTEEELEDVMAGKDDTPKEEDLPMESIVECETLYDYRTLKFVNMYVIRIKRKSQIISIVMSIITFAIAAGLLTYTIINKQNNWWLGCIIAVLGLWTLYNALTEERKIDKQLQKYFTTHKPFTQKFLINKDKVRVIVEADGETHKADYPWAYVQSIDVIPEYYYLFTNGGSPLVIDKDAMKFSKGTLEDLDAIIREEATLKPFKYYDKPFVKHFADIKYPEDAVEADPDFDDIKAEDNKEEEKQEENK